ncbi:MAG: hypothetical protein HN945_11235, partial [Deltaproteobacteria bacterium]|nr:hypothetical protein [Deltaproteobacteria bacterium]
GIVGKGAKGNEDKANSAQTLTRQSLQETKAGNAQMKKMLKSMQQITHTSEDVSKLRKCLPRV